MSDTAQQPNRQTPASTCIEPKTEVGSEGTQHYPTPAPKPPPAFTVYCERQDDGRYHIAMTPEAALMRWYPLGFFLTPDEARSLAEALTLHAALADSPGSVPGECGSGSLSADMPHELL